MRNYLYIAKAMSPTDRAEIIALADGFGHRILRDHRPETVAFAERWPGVCRVSPVRGRWFTAQPTTLGLQVARMIERFDLPVEWPEVGAKHE